MQVRVQVDDTVSSPVKMPVVATVPDLYTWTRADPGQASSSTRMVPSTAARIRRRTDPSLRSTGLGRASLSPQLPKGALVISTPYPTMPTTPTVTIAGQPAEVRYAGAAPYFPLGVFEIDVRIPPGIPAARTRICDDGRPQHHPNGHGSGAMIPFAWMTS